MIGKKVVITNSYNRPAYFCSTLMNVRTAALCGDRDLLLSSELDVGRVTQLLEAAGYEVTLDMTAEDDFNV